MIKLQVTALLCIFAIVSANGQNYLRTETMLNMEGTNSKISTQFYDPLGRPSQVADNGDGNGTSYVHTLLEYDLNGRESVKWCPIATSLQNELSHSFFSSRQDSSYGYGITEYDGLNRPVFISTPGAIWHQAGKGKTMNYISNGDDVKHYTADNITSSNVPYYSSGTLTGEEIIDEDGHGLTIYKDMMGNVVLERRGNTNNTYYVYNDLCQLSYVLPPIIDSLYTNGITENILDLYAYKYIYDGYGRCVEKKLPGCESIRYWYDINNRIAFMQNGRMQNGEDSEYRFYLYDPFGRLAIQGVCNSIPASIGSMPATAVYIDGGTGFCNTRYSLQTGYAPSNPSIEIVNYYDDYAFLTNSYILSVIGVANFTNTYHCNATSLLTGQLVFATGGQPLCSVLYYDEKGNVIDKRETVLGGGNLKTSIHYTFTNNPDTIVETLTKNGSTYTMRQINQYDPVTDKLKTQKHKYGTRALTTTAYYGYNDLGLVDTLRQHNGNITTIYSHDIHGWLTDIDSKLTSSGNQLFREHLRYADGLQNPCYNGNISESRWIAGNSSSSYAYRYAYDGLNRLASASFYVCAPMNIDGYTPQGNLGDVSYTYDANSNLTGVNRYGKTNTGYGETDRLSLSYSGNHLTRVTQGIRPVLASDAFGFKDGTIYTAGDEYGYDQCGSQIYDANKGITDIRYDLLGNPVRIQFSDYSVTEYVYAADGRRLKTIHRTSVPRSEKLGIGSTATLTTSGTLSVDSTEYVGNFIYENNTFKQYNFDGGYMASTGSNYYKYYIKDHLGNNRVVADNQGNVLQTTHYYPYGGFLSQSTNQEYQKYKYNGKELDLMHGLNEYDYGARQLDPAICQFTSMDPFCERYYHISPYAYCGGNPVNRVDPDGRLIKVIGDDEFRSWVLSTLRELTNDKLVMDKKGYISVAERGSGNLSVGTGLLREVIGDKHTAFVKKGENSESPVLLDGKRDWNFGGKWVYSNGNDPYNGKGTDVNIHLQPGTYSEALVSRNENENVTKERSRPEYVGAGHELIHGLRDMKGEAVLSESVSYFYNNNGAHREQASLEELQTVGINGNYRYTENKIRKEHGLKQRRNYKQ